MSYLSIPIMAAQWNLLRFKWQDQMYEFRCLLFGVNSAPRVFTKVLKPILALIRHGFRIIAYLNASLGSIVAIQYSFCRRSLEHPRGSRKSNPERSHSTHQSATTAVQTAGEDACHFDLRLITLLSVLINGDI